MTAHLQDTISNLKCRTTEFVNKAGVGSFVPSEAGTLRISFLRKVTNIVAGCPANLPTTEQAVEAGCPLLGSIARHCKVLLLAEEKSVQREYRECAGREFQYLGLGHGRWWRGCGLGPLRLRRRGMSHLKGR